MKLLVHKTTWKSIRNIILCEGGQMQKRPYYMVPFIQSIKSGKTELSCE